MNHPRQLYDLAQDYHSFKRYASTLIEVDSQGEWLGILESIPPEGNRLMKNFDEWTLGRLIIQGLKSAIGDHGTITAILIPSALKRIMGKIKEWNERHNTTQSVQRNRLSLQGFRKGLESRPDLRATGS